MPSPQFQVSSFNSLPYLPKRGFWHAHVRVDKEDIVALCILPAAIALGAALRALEYHVHPHRFGNAFCVICGKVVDDQDLRPSLADSQLEGFNAKRNISRFVLDRYDDAE